MKTPFITIHSKRLQKNVQTFSTLCKSHGVTLTGVTKGTLAHPEVVRCLIAGGVSWLGDARLDNLERLRRSGIHAPLLLMRSPAPSEIERTIQFADVSLNSELTVLERLSEAALSHGKQHEVILMVDMGDLREGVLPADALSNAREILKMKGIRLSGLGTNLTDLNGVLPTLHNNQWFVEIAEEIEAALPVSLKWLSAGNSSSIKLMIEGHLPKRINHFRMGESLLLGRETAYGDFMPDTHADAITLTAEVIEDKVKPSVPIGELGMDAFGSMPCFEDRGDIKRCILNLGRQDVRPEGLIPLESGLMILGATSDHLVVDASGSVNLTIGDTVTFRCDYGAILSAMTSPFVQKNIEHD